MPSKFKKALDTVKDQTSIGLAKVSLSSNLDLLVLKATTHDEHPIDDRHVSDILHLTSSSPPNASSCVHALSRRIDRTRNWVVALKCLHLFFRLLRDGSPQFPREAVSAMRRGTLLLDISSFRDESTASSPWDYTSFVRTFALYLADRLECALRGKLQTRRPMTGPNRLYDMKPPAILDRIAYLQRLLYRAISTRPTGPAKNSALVHVSLYLVVRESFDLYKDVSDGLALILDSFFQLQHSTCVKAYQTCVRAAKQFEDLAAFYDVCRGIAVGRRSEYPEVQKISGELLQTLNEFIKSNQKDPSSSSSSSAPATTRKTKASSAPAKEDSVELVDDKEVEDGVVEEQRKSIESGSGTGDRASCTLSDLVFFSDDDESNEESKATEQNGPLLSREGGSEPFFDLLMFDEIPNGDITTPERGDSTTSAMDLFHGLPNVESNTFEEEEQHRPTDVVTDMVVFNDKLKASTSSRSWELVLAETAGVMSRQKSHSYSEVFETAAATADGFIGHASTSSWGHTTPPEYTNPFLDDAGETGSSLVVWTAPATSQPPPTFFIGNSEESAVVPRPEMDPFRSSFDVVDESVRQQLMQQEQQMWLQQKNNVIASRNLAP